jgi:curved DNA-binding protein CbpA
LDSDNYYEILGVPKEASRTEIKIAYRRLARKYHPDRNPNVSEEVMKKINIAFEVLSDPEKRTHYNTTNADTVFGNEEKQSYPYADTGASAGRRNSRKKSKRGREYHFHNSANGNSNNVNGYYFSQNAYSKQNQTQKAVSNEDSSANDPLPDPESRYKIIVEPSLCLAFGSCETLAPEVFVVEKDKPINPKAIVKSETGAEFETILDAAKTCPTKAIIIIDRHTGEMIFP